MRCFIAIDVGSKVLKNIGRVQDEIRRMAGPEKGAVKWVDPDLMHLTIKFLGEVGDDRIADICKAVKDTAGQFEKFTVEVKKVGSFDNPPQVVWIGIDKNEILTQLQQTLDGRLAEIGFAPDEKKFVGHLTLCRVKKFEFGRRLGQVIKEYSDFSAGNLEIDSVCVYKSKLTKTGPEYTLLSRCKLN